MRLTGTWLLTRRALRRDRVLVASWLVVLTATVGASAGATASLYPTSVDRVAAASAIDASPAIVVLYGPILDVGSLGELAMTKLTVLYAVLVAVLGLVLVRRHTRTEEESGRAELVGATAVTRDAPLAAALLEAGLVALAVGILAAAADVAGGLPVVGSIAFGASWAGAGLVGAGIGAVACQVAASARTCGVLAAGVLGALFLVRALGDTSVPRLGWVSPLGWGTRLRAWGDPRWWVLALPVATSLLLGTAAFVLRAHRDLGSGLVGPRPGRAHGSPRLGGAVALAARLHAPALATWTGAVVVTGLVLGAIAPDIGSLLDSPAAREAVRRMGGVGTLERSLLAAELSVVAVVVTCFAITVVVHAGADERDGRTELVLGTAASRSASFAGTALVALLGSAWLLLATGVAVALGYGRDRLLVVGAALAQAPAVWLVAALALAAYAVRARWASAGWGLLVAFLTLGQLGELLRLPRWLTEASPYAHVPRVPAEPFALLPAATLVGLTAVVLVLARWRHRSRDVG
ncbi:multidrug efflux ABC transporter permease [Nocardioides korecus]